jgi:hypothetical protein
MPERVNEIIAAYRARLGAMMRPRTAPYGLSA